MDWMLVGEIILLLGACLACFIKGMAFGGRQTLDALVDNNLIVEEDLWYYLDEVKGKR
jgi:hypothetical protein